MEFIVFSLVVYAPILAANQAGSLPGLKYPVDPRLGDHKTVGVYLYGPLLGALMVYIEQEYFGLRWPHGLWDGLFVGFGAVLGDHIKSYFKRRQNIEPGAPWWPWDQLDYVFSGMAFLYVIVPYNLRVIAIVVALALVIHPVGNRIGYQLGLRATPH